MLVPTIIMAILAIILSFWAYKNGEHVKGLSISWNLFIEIFPLLCMALIVAGMVQVLLPVEFISHWIGKESGFRGILIGTFLGAMAPGGPFVSMPLALGFYKAGAGIGTTVAFLSGWSLIAVNRLPMEIGVMGVRLTLVRLACTFFFPPIAGFLAHVLFEKS